MRLFASLRNRLLLVILLATLPLLAGVLDGYRRERNAAVQGIEDDIRTLMRVLIQRDAEVAKDIELILRIMGNAGDMQTPTAEGCSRLAQRLMKSQPDFANIGAVWPDGAVFCSARPMTQAINVGDRGWFKEVTETRRPSSGHYQIGRVSGERAVTYGYPLLDDRGNSRLALFAAVKLDWFGRLLRQVQLPPLWHAFIVTRDGVLAAQYRSEGNTSQPFDHDMHDLLGEPPTEPAVRTWTQGKVEHLHGIAPLPTTRGELFVVVGTDTREAMAPIDRRLRIQILLALGFALASGLLAWFALRNVADWADRMNAVLRRFGGGDLSSRAGKVSKVTELQSLSDQFDGMAASIQSLTQDLESRVQQRTAALSRSNAELEAFAYSVSHDLRAPLRAIDGFAEILGERYRDSLDSEGQRYLDNVIRAAGQMNRLIDDLLQYSRVGRGEPQIERIDLAGLLRDITMLFQQRLGQNGRIEIAEPLANPLGDARLIGQILTNLIDNAIKYQPPGQAPVVRVASTAQDGHVTIRVSDNGIGIAPEYRERIFDVFQRLHGEDEYPGTGIGLAIARKATRLMNGTLDVDSEPGQGSTFVLTLPAGE